MVEQELSIFGRVPAERHSRSPWFQPGDSFAELYAKCRRYDRHHLIFGSIPIVEKRNPAGSNVCRNRITNFNSDPGVARIFSFSKVKLCQSGRYDPAGVDEKSFKSNYYKYSMPLASSCSCIRRRCAQPSIPVSEGRHFGSHSTRQTSQTRVSTRGNVSVAESKVLKARQQ
jgi:hypothetical protein